MPLLKDENNEVARNRR